MSMVPSVMTTFKRTAIAFRAVSCTPLALRQICLHPLNGCIVVEMAGKHSIVIVEDFLVSMRSFHHSVGGIIICVWISTAVLSQPPSPFNRERDGGYRASGRGRNEREARERTDASAEVCRCLHFDTEVSVDFADDLHGMADGEMAILCILPSAYGRRILPQCSLCSTPLSILRLGIWRRTRFNITSTLPPASMTAVSPRSWTTFPSMRTILCWKLWRWVARMRGVWGWSIAASDSRVPFGVGVGGGIKGMRVIERKGGRWKLIELWGELWCKGFGGDASRGTSAMRGHVMNLEVLWWPSTIHKI